MDERRSYKDLCSTARALDVVGERWALLVVRELLLGPKRFSDLQRGLQGISRNVLAQRLKELERDRVVRRRQLGPYEGVQVYELTDWGAGLGDVVDALAGWGQRAPAPAGAAISVDALLVALRTSFSPVAPADVAGRYALQLGADSFVAEVADGVLTAGRSEATDVVATVRTDVATMMALAFAGHPLEAAMANEAARCEGDQERLERLLASFTAGHP